MKLKKKAPTFLLSCIGESEEDVKRHDGDIYVSDAK